MRESHSFLYSCLLFRNIMSLFDLEISKNIWNGKIPIKITLDPTETDVYGNDKVWDPVYVRMVLY